jgi:hemerythrin-like domain-containing protein
MGACLPVQRAALPQALDDEADGSAANAPAPPAEVMVFALLHNTHEALRGLLLTLVDACKTCVASPSVYTSNAVQVAWRDLLTVVDWHRRMEDLAVFPLLNKLFTGVIRTEQLHHEHESDMQLQAATQAAFDTLIANPSDATAASALAAAESFSASHEQHLVHEEKVMMPLTLKVDPPAWRPGLLHDLLAIDMPAASAALPLVVRELSSRNPFPSTRMLVLAVQRICTPEEYAVLLPLMREAAGPFMWKKLYADGCGAPGRLTQADLEVHAVQKTLVFQEDAFPLGSEPPRVPEPPADVVVFALLRNTHEGLRGLLLTLVDACKACVAAPTPTIDAAAAVQQAWRDFLTVVRWHGHMEDLAMFPLLNKLFNGVASTEQLPNEHESDMQRQATTQAAFDALTKARNPGTAAAALAAAQSFAASHEEHLVHEEKVMMPLTVKVDPPAWRPGLLHDFLTIDMPAAAAALPLVVREMSNRNPFPSTRMLVQAVQRVCTPEEYAVLMPLMRVAAGATWGQLYADGCFAPGRLTQADLEVHAAQKAAVFGEEPFPPKQ